MEWRKTPKNGTVIRTARYYVEVLGKAPDVLEVLRNSGTELRLTDTAQAAHLDISPAFRLLSALEGRGYVLRDQRTKRFRVRLGDRAHWVGYAQVSPEQPFPPKVTQGLVEAAKKSRVEWLVRDN
jgi:DNA-binding IclR family transcriptional regulator